MSGPPVSIRLGCDQPLVWFSGAANREMSMPRGLLVSHFFSIIRRIIAGRRMR